MASLTMNFFLDQFSSFLYNLVFFILLEPRAAWMANPEKFPVHTPIVSTKIFCHLDAFLLKHDVYVLYLVQVAHDDAYYLRYHSFVNAYILYFVIPK